MDYANLVAETCVTTGTGAFSFSGGILNSRTLLSALTDGEEYGYRIEHIDGLTVGYEVGTGTWDATAETLARTTVENSSNSDAAVDWPAGTKLLEITLTAAQINAFIAAGKTTHIDSSDAGGVYGSLSGLVNGSNAVYTVSQSVYLSGTLQVWVNGVMQSGVEITETTPGSGIFTLSFAPPTGSTVMVKYEKNA